jgi:hypothetical protein
MTGLLIAADEPRRVMAELMVVSISRPFRLRELAHAVTGKE